MLESTKKLLLQLLAAFEQAQFESYTLQAVIQGARNPALSSAARESMADAKTRSLLRQQFQPLYDRIGDEEALSKEIEKFLQTLPKTQPSQAN
ncbi:MAG: hypothetical protein WCC87_10210 [Candidatus Korobacteraceae bacterium]